MPAPGLFPLALLLRTAAIPAVTAQDTAVSVTALDTVSIAAGSIPAAVADTPRARPRRRAVEISEWYNRRLTIHRYLSYSVIPLFTGEYVAGRRLFDQSHDAPTWAITGHRALATALAGVFTVNTVTGAWNLWESRSVEQGRTLRTVHVLSMLAADGGFTYAGAVLSDQAEHSREKRQEHRTIALASMGLTIGSALMMKMWNR